MDNRQKIASLITELDERAPAGLALGLHIEYTTPRFMVQTYPKKWVETYDARGFLLHDPVVQWGFQNTGSIRWRELAEVDPMNVIGEAARFGMTHGAMIAIVENGTRSFGGFARSDREYLDYEMDVLHGLVRDLHLATQDVTEGNSEDYLALKQLSDRLTRS